MSSGKNHKVDQEICQITLGISLGEHSASARLEGVWPLLQKVLQQKFKSETRSFKTIGTFAQNLAGSHGSSWVSIDQMNANGLRAVLPKVPFFWRLLQKWKKTFSSQKVDLLILVDFADFNLRLAQIAKASNVPVVWLAPPQMWAWRPERKALLRGVSLACLFEFEAELYKSWGLNAYWVGFKNPEKLNFDATAPLGVFPGSRKAVLQRQAPLQIALAQQYALHTQKEWVWILPNENLREYAKVHFPHFKEKMLLQNEVTSLSRALTLPGTATLEIALAGIPMQVVYRGSFLEKKIWLNKAKKKEIPHFALPNLLLQKRAYSESFFTNFASKFASDFAPLKAEWPSLPQAETQFMPLIPEQLVPNDEYEALESWITKKA